MVRGHMSKPSKARSQRKTAGPVRLGADDPRAREAITKANQALRDYSLERKKQQPMDDKTASALRTLKEAFEEQITANPRAAAALSQLRKYRFETIKIPDKIDISKRAGHPGAFVMSLQLDEHVSVISPPYDYDWSWGNMQTNWSERREGAVGVDGGAGALKSQTVTDNVKGAAGIGIVLTSDKSAWISVHPYIQYSWHYAIAAAGPWASASAKGGINAAAFNDGKFIAGPRLNQLFADSVADLFGDTHKGSDEGYTWVPDLPLHFRMNPGDVVAVNFGGYVECNTDRGLGQAASVGLAVGVVHWVVIERFVAG